MVSSSLDGFCGEPFWDYQLTWNTSNPDVTQCFQKTVLVWIPCCFLWFFAPLETYYLLKSSAKDIPWTALNIAKLIITSVLTLLCLSNLGHNVFNAVSKGDVPSVDFYEPFIKFISFALVICFVICGRMKGIQSSGVLFLFWFILMLCEAITYRSYIMHAVDDISVAESFPFVIFMLYYPLVLVEFILSCFSDGRPQYTEYSFEDERTSPENSASFLSRLLYWWFNGLVFTGWKRPLTTGDLWSLNYQDQSERVVPIFDKYWNAELMKTKMAVKSASYSPRRSTDDVKFTGLEPKSKPTVVKALVKAFGLVFLQGAVFKLFQDILQFVSPQILKLLIEFVSSDDPLWKGVFYAVIIFLSSTLQSVMLAFYFHRMYIVAMRIRTSLISAIYRKALILSNSAKRKSTLGEIVNLMSVDAQKCMDLMPFLNLLWSAPLQIILALVFLWDVLGPSVLAGLIVMVLVIPLNGVIANLSKKLQVDQMKSKDERVKVMNEILGGIKVLKLYAWEESFQDQVLTIRDKELQKLRKMAYLSAVMSFIWTCAPYLVSLVSFATYVLSSEEHVLNAQRAFVALTLFQILRFPLSMLPMLITMLVQASVSIKRINEFLTNEELDQYVEYDHTDPNSLTIEHGTFAWQKDESMTLKNVSLAVPKGSLVAVVGQVGAGKSSLLSALLGDMEKIEGRVNRKGSVAYVAQQAWVQNATLRDNILFYHPYNKEKYDKVVEACALKPDFSILPGEDLTEIGEKGINLSGGQKQRISLARAVYSDADIYLMDDPLSAVDSHVGKHIFENVIGPNGLLSKKTRVLVTHGITYLPQTDKVVVMKGGAILEEGSYKELLDKEGAFADFLLQYLRDDVGGSVEELEDQEIAVVEEIINKVGSPDLNRQLSLGGSEADIPNRNRETVIRSLSRQLSLLSHESSGSDHGVHQRRSVSKTRLDGSPLREENSSVERMVDGKLKLKEDVRQNGTEVNDNANLIQVETAETGRVKPVVYLHYAKSLGLLWAVLLALGYMGLQSFSVGANFWLSAWSNDKPKPDGSQDIDLRNLRLGVYAVFGLLQGVAVMIGATALAYGTIRASRFLHFKLLKQIFRSPMSFFETTPLGRIVNRFSKDVDTVDVTIPMTLRSWIICALHVLATVIVISAETPSFLIVIIPIGILYYFIQKFYVASSRQLKRLESITRSPIYSHFSETLAGVTTVRGYDAQRLFIKESNKLVDLNQVCYYPSVVANRWLGIRLEFCGNCIILFAALFAVLGRATLNPGSVGLSVSYALSVEYTYTKTGSLEAVVKMVTATLNWLVRMASELETNIVAVERIEEYATAPTEASWESEPSVRPADTWPSEGKINFEKYSTRYREGLDLVLKGITCDIQPGEKVGIVGRTGAGKSSLTLSLFRIIEATSGNILIDGVDISKIGLHDLRSSITIIPQDPVLFSGTLRLNLDPFNCHNDSEVWIALEHSHLKSFVSSLEDGLLHEVSEGGENLSVGQRQLVCLARALLRKTKVLVLDEATAAVDLETDGLIQSTIRTEFADCTILTIAHRLNTIMDYDKVMVLDRGVIKEFDAPETLLEKKQSLFYSMAKDAGLA